MSEVDEAYAAKVHTETKHYQKQARQQLKLQCLGLAVKDGVHDADEVVKNAKAFYAFART